MADVMGVRAAAEFLGISTDTLYRYADGGLVPAFKFHVTGGWRFSRKTLEQWMEIESRKHMKAAKAGKKEQK